MWGIGRKIRLSEVLGASTRKEFRAPEIQVSHALRAAYFKVYRVARRHGQASLCPIILADNDDGEDHDMTA